MGPSVRNVLGAPEPVKALASAALPQLVDPTGIRTPVSALRRQRPGPLDDGVGGLVPRPLRACQRVRTVGAPPRSGVAGPFAARGLRRAAEPPSPEPRPARARRSRARGPTAAA